MPFDETISTPDWNGLLRIAGNLPLPDPNWNAAMPNPDSIVKTPQYPLSGYTATEREEIQQQMLQKVDHLRNTSILVLGDSVDRNADPNYARIVQWIRFRSVEYQVMGVPAHLPCWRRNQLYNRQWILLRSDG